MSAVSRRPRRLARIGALLWAAGGVAGCQLFTGDEPRPGTVAILPPAITFDAVGERALLVAEVRDQLDQLLADAVVSWSSSDPSVVSVTDAGQVTALGNGVATITATAGTASSSITATVMQLATTLAKVSGDAQVGPAGEPLPRPLVVQALDRLGRPAAEVPIDFRVVEGNGRVARSQVATDSEGRASVEWTLGLVAGQAQAVRGSLAFRVGVGVGFEASTRAGLAAEIVVLSGDDQTAPLRSTLSEPIWLRVQDRFGNAVEAADVRFDVVRGGGSVAPGSAATDSEGHASAEWTLGDSLGAQSLSVQVGPLPPTILSANATEVPEQLRVLEGDGQTGPAGTALPHPISVRVHGAGDAPIPSLDVKFSVAAGSGMLQATDEGEFASELLVRTDPGGVAALGRWILGTLPGLQILEAEVPGLPTVTLSATALPGPAAALDKISGDGQAGSAEALLPEPLVVHVTDMFGNAVPGETVTFTPAPGHGTVEPARVVTDAGGRGLARWSLGAPVGEQSVTASVSSGASNIFRATASGGDGTGGFTIELRFIDLPTASRRQAFERAVRRWSDLIPGKAEPTPVKLSPGSCGPGSPAVDQIVDDLLVLVRLDSIDGFSGTLGLAGTCSVRSSARPPLVSRLVLDTADVTRLEAAGGDRLVDLILHELAHALGFGTLWVPRGLLVNPSLPASRGADTHFRGPAAIAAFDEIGGARYAAGEKVPVENESGGPGTRDTHWRTSVFVNELMTGFLTRGANPLSRVTLASLEDLGYEVDLAAADTFEPALTPPALAPGPGLIPLGNDVLEGPFYVVEPDGTISEVVPE